MADYVSAKALKERLTKTRDIEIDGQKFAIQRVVLSKFGDIIPKDINKLTTEETQKYLVDQLTEKDLTEVMKPVLIAGIVSPKVSDIPQDDSVEDTIHVDLLFRDIILCSKLYKAIAEYSAENF